MTPDTAAALLGLAILIGIVVIVGLPLIDASPGKKSRRAESRSTVSRQADLRAQLLEERNVIYAAIHELDFEHETHKLSDEDYSNQRAELVEASVAILKQLDQLAAQTPADDQLEQTIAQVRDGSPRAVDDAEMESRIDALRRGETPQAPIEAEG